MFSVKYLPYLQNLQRICSSQARLKNLLGVTPCSGRSQRHSIEDGTGHYSHAHLLDTSSGAARLQVESVQDTDLHVTMLANAHAHGLFTVGE